MPLPKEIIVFNICKNSRKNPLFHIIKMLTKAFEGVILWKFTQ